MFATESPFPQYFDLDGSPLTSGAIYFGVANQNPETAPATVYWDAAGTQPAAQPIATLNGYAVRNGTAAMVYAATDYSLTVKNRKGATVYYAASSANFSNGSITAAFIAAIAAPTGSSLVGHGALTVASALRGVRINVEEYRLPGYGDMQTLAAAKVACDALITIDSTGFYSLPTLLIPAKHYTLTADFTMPNCGIECQGTFVGNYSLVFSYPRHISCNGLAAKFIKVIGAYFCVFNNYRCTKITLLGGGVGFGLFWNSFTNCFGDVLIDLENWSINQNLFSGGRGNIVTVGTSGTLFDGHMNNTVNWDLTSVSSGYYNDSTVQQTSNLITPYFEVQPSSFSGDGVVTTFNFAFRAKTTSSFSVQKWNAGVFTSLGLGVDYSVTLNTDQGRNPGGTVTYPITGGALPTGQALYMTMAGTIEGPVNIIGLQGDLGESPKVTIRNHVFATAENSERGRGDFLALSSNNLIAGGDWDQLNLDGSGNIKPVGVFINPPSQAITITDATEPFGFGTAYGGNFTADFSLFQLAVPPCPSGSFVLVFSYKGVDFTSTYVDRGAGDVTYYGSTGTNVDGTWKIFRMAGKANKTAITYINFFITGLSNVGTKTVFIGGLHLTQNKAAILPSPKRVRKLETNTIEVQGVYQQWGTVTKAATANTGGYVEIAVSFPKAFSAAPTSNNGACTFSVELNDVVNGITMTKAWIKSGSVSINGFIVQVATAASWQGLIHWSATGAK